MKKFFVLLSFYFFSGFVHAESFSEIPSKWRLESYGATGVVLWTTPATCGNGQIFLPSTATLSDHNRLYATVSTAKAAGLKVFIYYSNDSGICTIVSYGLDGS